MKKTLTIFSLVALLALSSCTETTSIHNSEKENREEVFLEYKTGYMTDIALCEPDENVDTLGFSLDTDYMESMISCCLSGDFYGGLQAEQERNKKIDALNLDDTKISFNDLMLLSKIITAEAGSSWLSMEWKMMVGEVLLNRVASPEFPNSIEECIYQNGQYYSAGSSYFESLIPFEDCVYAAARLLSGERIINDGSVVFQANFKQGSGTYIKLYDERLGYTYLCYSNYPELYES